MRLAEPLRTSLGIDPTNRACAINGYAFQQDAIRTFNDWQYACFYASSSPSAKEPLFVHLSRRKLPDGPWQTIRFEDYPQTVDDGHNTVQLGICPGDGTIHLSYDHHCDVLRYRHSKTDVVTSPETVNWSPELFTSTLSTLPGLESGGETIAELLGYITYPRFVTRGQDLLFTFRTGKAGLGDDHLCVYTASTSSSSLTFSTSSSLPAAESTNKEPEVAGARTDLDIDTEIGNYSYKFLGTHLRGVWNNPYIHGLDVSPDDSNTLHITWVYREFVEYPGWDNPLDTKYKAQAGPNSAANNRDICYAWSADGGLRWHAGVNSERTKVIADLEKGESILPTSPGIVAIQIPKGSGLTNQESQAVDYDGGVHVLNRDTLDRDGNGGAVVRWKHYYLDPRHGWTQRILPHVEGACGGKRGQLAVSRDGNLYFVLPHQTDPFLTILKVSKESKYAEYELVWQGDGFPSTDPLVDKARLQSDNVLSVFTRSLVGPEGNVNVTVLDFPLE